MKLMGVDYGRRRIGVAVTDETGAAIRGLTTIRRAPETDPLERLEQLAREQNPAAVVFGVPLGPDDEETVMSREARAFAARLEARIDQPIHFVDESYSSHKAEELLRFRRKKYRRDKAAVDRLAACLILEEYRRESHSV
jgi:putative Holliday junction resolvase